MSSEATLSTEAQPESLLERFHKATKLVDSDPAQAVSLLTSLQHDVASRSLFSSNESLEDISSRSLSLLMLEHQLAMAYTCLPTGPAEISSRLQHLRRACDLWNAFLGRLQALERLTADDQRQYQELLELTSDDNDQPLPPPTNRDAKIARFKAKQASERERERLQSLRNRRSRLGVASEDEMDGHDEESLERTLALQTIDISKVEALEEWSSTLLELPMIARMLQAQEERQGQERYAGTGTTQQSKQDERARPHSSNKPLHVTHITQDAKGQLQVRREEIQSQVFRPGWNQPTMTLQELGERELQQALEREERQKESEAARKHEPRRMEQLVKDGMEDNADLVDASAALDRQWDDWKDENPRGSGNKRGDVGDRNF